MTTESINTTFPHQVELLIGPPEETDKHLFSRLQKLLCPHQSPTPSADCFCRICQSLKRQQHYDILWLKPEKQYTIETIEPLFDRLSFLLDRPHLTIIPHAELLTITTSNKLLKVLEEPPAGHYFILQTSNPSVILATVRSRCQQTYLKEENPSVRSAIRHHPLLRHLTRSHQYDPIGFDEQLRTLGLSDQQSTDLAYDLLGYFHAVSKSSLESSDDRLYARASARLLLQRLRFPPQSGSADLFWRHLYLLMHHHISKK